MLSPGIVLQQRYRIKRLLAHGGMGAVYEAEAVHLRDAIVAVKETFFSEDRQGLRLVRRPFQCRSASRDSWSAGMRMDDVGFRIVRAYR